METLAFKCHFQNIFQIAKLLSFMPLGSFLVVVYVKMNFVFFVTAVLCVCYLLYSVILTSSLVEERMNLNRLSTK